MKLMDTNNDVTGPVNIGHPDEFTVRELAEKVIVLTGSSSKIVSNPLPEDDPKQRQPDISIARSLLNWEPTVALDAGLRKTIDFYQRGYQIINVTKATRLSSFTIHSQRLLTKSLNDEITDDPPVVDMHSRSIRIKNSRDFHIDLPLTMVVKA